MLLVFKSSVRSRLRVQYLYLTRKKLPVTLRIPDNDRTERNDGTKAPRKHKATERRLKARVRGATSQAARCEALLQALAAVLKPSEQTELKSSSCTDSCTLLIPSFLREGNRRGGVSEPSSNNKRCPPLGILRSHPSGMPPRGGWVIRARTTARCPSAT